MKKYAVKLRHQVNAVWKFSTRALERNMAHGRVYSGTPMRTTKAVEIPRHVRIGTPQRITCSHCIQTKVSLAFECKARYTAYVYYSGLLIILKKMNHEYFTWYQSVERRQKDTVQLTIRKLN